MSNTLDYYKLLPKTNCGECGSPTCLAFAMRLAQKNASASDCPSLSDDIKTQLDEATLPPIKELVTRRGKEEIHIGGETVFYRHEKKFCNETVFCIAISDLDSEEVVSRKVQMKSIERLADNLSTNMIALCNDSKEKEPYIKLVRYIQKTTNMPLCLLCEDMVVLESALEELPNNQAIIGFGTENSIQKISQLAEKYRTSIILSSQKGIEGLAELEVIAKEHGIKDLILDCTGKNIHETIENQILLRWNAVYNKDRRYGYPIISFPLKHAQDDFAQEIVLAGLLTIKYSSIVVLSDNVLNQLVPLLVLRQNIFTDPQKPIQVDPGVYTFGEVDGNSPIFLTTNFSLTYFTVSNDIESSGYPGYLLVIDTEGTSVLTAYAADKLSAEKIAEAIANENLASKVNHKSIIIPGFLSPLSSEIEDASSWKVLVGPTDSAEIGYFLNKFWRTKVDDN